jgi:nitroreductase
VNECLPIPRISDVTPEQCEKLLRSRRSIRVYKKKKISRSLITRIIDIVGYSPSSCNSQSVEWLVVDEKEQLDSVRNAGIDWLHWNIANQVTTKAPIDFKHMLEREEKGTDDLFHHAPLMIIAHGNKYNPMGISDGVIALAYFNLMANCLGLGCCWNGLFNDMANSFPPMQNVLKLPENNQVWGCLLVGYPKLKFQRYPLRMVPRITWL